MSERNVRFNSKLAKADALSESILSPKEFTLLFSAYLQHSYADLIVEVTGELELETREGEKKNGRKSFLDNAYSVYLQNPEARDDVIEGFVASHLNLINNGISETIDLGRVVPVVKDKAWVENLMESLASHDSKLPQEEATPGLEKEEDPQPQAQDEESTSDTNNAPEKSDFPLPVHESLNSELDVVYAEDSKHNIRYLNHSNLQSLGIDQQRLREQAVKNLTSLLQGEVEAHYTDGVFLINAGGNYEASFLLIDDFWDSLALEVEGDYVVAIPTRDLLLVTGSQNLDGIERVRSVAGDASQRGAYALTPVLFVRKDGSFEVFEG